MHKTDHPEEFTRRYAALLRHYCLEGRKIQRAEPHENGDVEQRHHRLKRALDQALMLRGSRDFESREAYAAFLSKLFAQLNAGRRERLAQELQVLRRLPRGRLEACKCLRVRVSPGSTISVDRNVYSVDSRMIGEQVEVRVYAEHLEVWYAQRRLESLPRLRGRGKHRIHYRHVIDWLVRKPGAFENYRYREDLFPTSRFRMAYDALRKRHAPGKASKEYLGILHQAARESEIAVDEALRLLIECGEPITAEAVDVMVQSGQRLASPMEITIPPVNLAAYDAILAAGGVG